MIEPSYCLKCKVRDCGHLRQRSRKVITPREFSILRKLLDPQYRTAKEAAFALGISLMTWKADLSRLYRKLGWVGGNTSELILWAVANRETLGLELPTPEQWPGSV